MSTLARILDLLSPARKWIVASILLGMLAVISSVGLIATSTYLIATAAFMPSIAVLQVSIVGVRFFGLSRAVFRYLERIASHKVSFHLLTELRLSFFDGLARVVPAGIRGTTSGDLYSRVMGDLDVLQNFYVRVMAPIIIAVISIGLFPVIAGFANLSLALMIGAGLLLSAAAILLLGYFYGRKVFHEVQVLRGRLSTHLVEYVDSLPELLVLGREGVLEEKIGRLSKSYIAAQVKWNRLTSALEGISILGAHGTTWLVLLAGVRLVESSMLSSTLLAVIVLSILAAFEAVNALGSASQFLLLSQQAATRMEAIIDTPDPVKQGDFALDQDKPIAIQLVNAHFRYQEDQAEVFSGLNLEITPGKVIGILGPSGGGKSTLFNLVSRSYELDDGAINVNGRWIGEINLNQYRERIMHVDPECRIFKKTVRENLNLFETKLSEEDLLLILEQVGLTNWLQKLPKGLDTILDPTNLPLSTGERQKLLLARLIAADRDINLLDEPLANLDAASEKEVADLLNRKLQDKSVLWISHQLETLPKCDEYLFIKDWAVHHYQSLEDLKRVDSAYRSWKKGEELEDWGLTNTL